MGEAMTYERRVIAMSIAPEGEPLFSEMATEVRIVDDAAGEFVEVIQHGRSDVGKVCINPEEWSELRLAIDEMVSKCKVNQ